MVLLGWSGFLQWLYQTGLGPTPWNKYPNIFQPSFFRGYTRKTNMTMENTPFEDVSAIKDSDFPLPC